MRWAPPLIVALLISPRLAAGFEPGDKVVVIRSCPMQATTGSPVPLPAGATLTVVAPEQAESDDVAIGPVNL